MACQGGIEALVEVYFVGGVRVDDYVLSPRESIHNIHTVRSSAVVTERNDTSNIYEDCIYMERGVGSWRQSYYVACSS